MGEGFEAALLLTGSAGVSRRGRRLQGQDVLRQTAVPGQTEDMAQPKPVTQIQNLWRAIVTVGAQQDFGLGPMPADLADQAANVGCTLGPSR